MTIAEQAEAEAIRRGYAGRRVHCLVCDTVIQSQHRHDMHSCACTEGTRVYVDGGSVYLRIMWEDGADFAVLDEEVESGDYA